MRNCGLATLFAALPPRVSARRRGPLRGAVAGVLTRPLAFVMRTADRLTPEFLEIPLAPAERLPDR